jgi:hypothetical protein
MNKLHFAPRLDLGALIDPGSFILYFVVKLKKEVDKPKAGVLCYVGRKSRGEIWKNIFQFFQNFFLTNLVRMHYNKQCTSARGRHTKDLEN